jgi:small subunit ribosomal protein S3Ae
VVDVRTKDGFLIRIKPMSITEQRIQAAQETAIRNIMTATLNQLAADMTVSELVKSIITGDMSKDLGSAAKVIIPIKRIEVRKSEVLEIGNAAGDEPSIQERFGQEAAAQAAAQAAAAPQPPAAEASEEEVAEETEEQ